jgi:hypothetical protein
MWQTCPQESGSDKESSITSYLVHYASLPLLPFPLALQPSFGLGRLHETFSFTLVTRSRTVGRAPWMGDRLVARPLPVHTRRKTLTQHKYQTFMPYVGFEPTVPAFARAKTFPVSDRSAIVTSILPHYLGERLRTDSSSKKMLPNQELVLVGITA